LPIEKRKEAYNLIQVIDYDWSLQARDKQKLPDGDWVYWFIKAGRGFGKTRTGVETVRIWKEDNPITLLAGRTASDVRDIMIEGESGILRKSPHWDKPNYEPSKKRITWNNGAIAIIRSADEPDTFRGLQFHKAWLDELASWRYLEESWDQIQMGLRLGDDPKCVITTTPRPIKIIKELLKSDNTIVTHGSTYENKDNLADVFYNIVIKKYEGTRLGRQELNAEILEDTEGALWKLSDIDRNRVDESPDLVRVVVAIDPAVTAGEDSDETAIVVVGIDNDDYGYVLEDISGIYTPNTWAQKAVYMYEKWEADRIIAEVNNGGDLVEANIRNVNKNVSYDSVRATKGKYTRAEPIAALYERGQDKVSHVGQFNELEDQLTTWIPGDKSPDRLDALVWGLTYLMNNNDARMFVG
jgi:phage terminase large subunit-like protein